MTNAAMSDRKEQMMSEFKGRLLKHIPGCVESYENEWYDWGGVDRFGQEQPPEVYEDVHNNVAVWMYSICHDWRYDCDVMDLINVEVSPTTGQYRSWFVMWIIRDQDIIREILDSGQFQKWEYKNGSGYCDVHKEKVSP